MLDLTARFNTKEAAERGFTVTLKDPGSKTGAPILGSDNLPLFIRLLGGDAEKMRSLSFRNVNRHLEAVRKGNAQGSNTAEDNAREMIEKLAAATLDWHSDIGMDGKSLACTEANAKLLYADARVPWIAEQLATEFDDRSRFFSSSSTG